MSAPTTTDDAELIARLRLASVPGLSPRMQGRLVRALGSARAVLTARRGRLEAVRGVGAARTGLVLSAPGTGEAQDALERARRADVTLLWPGAEGWPGRLDDLPDPPLLLYARGGLIPADDGAVAIVGSRRASAYGLAQARRLSRDLAALGVTVLSGLARGVDTAAHHGALEGGGRTVAILGGGLARLYPAENLPLARSISGGRGAVLSEFPLDAPPRPFHFPRRNRLLAALARAVVVVEAGERSGSLITADHALDIGREVLAVPGRSGHTNTRGTHRLLREGAALCEDVVDIFRALGLSEIEPPGDAPEEGVVDEIEAALLAALADDEMDADDLMLATGHPPPAVLAALTTLELRGRILRSGDGRWGRSG